MTTQTLGTLGSAESDLGIVCSPQTATGALILAEIMLSKEPPSVRASLCRESVLALAAYLIRVKPSYCHAVMM